MEKQMNTSRCDIFVVLLLIISICISLAGCTVTLDVSDPTCESVTIEIPNTTTEDQILEETHSVIVPDESESTPPKAETVPTETTHAHSYSGKVTSPSCTAGGYTTFTCSCGDTYTADHTDAVGHNYNEKLTAATCTEMGYTTYTCKWQLKIKTNLDSPNWS